MIHSIVLPVQIVPIEWHEWIYTEDACRLFDWGEWRMCVQADRDHDAWWVDEFSMPFEYTGCDER